MSVDYIDVDLFEATNLDRSRCGVSAKTLGEYGESYRTYRGIYAEEIAFAYHYAKRALQSCQEKLYSVRGATGTLSPRLILSYIAVVNQILVEASRENPYRDITHPLKTRHLLVFYRDGREADYEEVSLFEKSEKKEFSLWHTIGYKSIIDTVYLRFEALGYAKIMKRLAILIEDSLKIDEKLTSPERINHLHSMLRDINEIKTYRQREKGWGFRYFTHTPAPEVVDLISTELQILAPSSHATRALPH